MAINPSDFAPAVIKNCQTHEVEVVELTPTEKQDRIARAAAHELLEQQKIAEKAAADDLLRVLDGNPNASVKASDLLILLKQLGLDPAQLSQTKSG